MTVLVPVSTLSLKERHDESIAHLQQQNQEHFEQFHTLANKKFKHFPRHQRNWQAFYNLKDSLEIEFQTTADATWTQYATRIEACKKISVKHRRQNALNRAALLYDVSMDNLKTMIPVLINSKKDDVLKRIRRKQQ